MKYANELCYIDKIIRFLLFAQIHFSQSSSAILETVRRNAFKNPRNCHNSGLQTCQFDTDDYRTNTCFLLICYKYRTFALASYTFRMMEKACRPNLDLADPWLLSLRRGCLLVSIICMWYSWQLMLLMLRNSLSILLTGLCGLHWNHNSSDWQNRQSDWSSRCQGWRRRFCCSVGHGKSINANLLHFGYLAL